MVGLTRLNAAVAELEARVAHHGHTVEVEADSGATSHGELVGARHEADPAGGAPQDPARRGAGVGGVRAGPGRRSRRVGCWSTRPRSSSPRWRRCPPTSTTQVAADAQATLVGYAEHHDARELRILGNRILEVVAPEVGEAHEAKLLEREEREAEAAASFRMVEDGHGKCHGRFTLSSLHGAMLRKQLLAIAAPKHRAQVDGQAPEPGRPSAHRLGEAFAEYIETYPTDRLPQAGGVSATVVVTMAVDTLMGGLKAAQLDTGHRISPGLARRLACRAGIIPAVLGTRSQVLDLGRRTRFHTEPQRIALAIEQRGCTAEGCDWPPGMCHAHHDQPFSTGGDTSVKNGRLLCPRHHARAHDPTYTTTRLPDGKLRFHRRT